MKGEIKRERPCLQDKERKEGRMRGGRKRKVQERPGGVKGGGKE